MFFQPYLIVFKPLKFIFFLLENYLCFLFVCYLKTIFPSHTKVMLRVFIFRKDTNFNNSFILYGFKELRMFLFNKKTELFPIDKRNASSLDWRSETIKCNKFWSFISLVEFVMNIRMLELWSCLTAKHWERFSVETFWIFWANDKFEVVLTVTIISKTKLLQESDGLIGAADVVISVENCPFFSKVWEDLFSVFNGTLLYACYLFGFRRCNADFWEAKRAEFGWLLPWGLMLFGCFK